MSSGESKFQKLPNLYVITITSYDPFGKDYMMYTFQNQCLEHSDLLYGDGLRFIYFNTEGTKGGTEAAVQEAVKEAIQETTQEVIQENILDFLEELGPVSLELEDRIRAEQDVDLLRKRLKLAAQSESALEFEDRICVELI